MAKAKRSGKSYSSYYATYKSGGIEAKNRLKKLTKLAKEQPNNEQITLAIKDIHHRRKIPKAPIWSHQEIAVAKVIKHFMGKFTRDWFHTDPKSVAGAATVRNDNLFPKDTKKTSQFQMFSLKERAKDKLGNYVWM